MDCSGFDQSHNVYLRQPWDYLIEQLAENFASHFSDVVNPEIFKQEFAKNKTKVIYTFMIDKKLVNYCQLDIGDKLGSGSVYTTVMNTFLMILLIKFAMQGIDNECTVSGDDALGGAEAESKDQIATQLYSVFGFKGNNYFNNIGVILKYCYESVDLRDAVPCSLDTFECPACGIKLVRHFFKYMRDTFISIKFEKKFKNLGITQQEFEQLVYTGELAWCEGLEFPSLVFSPLNHGIPIQEICNKIMGVLKARTIARMNIFSGYTEELSKLNGISKSQLALRLINLISGETFLKIRDIKNCELCNQAYEVFLLRNYNICTEKIRPFYNFPKKQLILYDGELTHIPTTYVPNEILRQSRLYYDLHMNANNRAPDDKKKKEILRSVLNNYYKEKIQALSAECFQSRPDVYSIRLDELVDLWMVLAKKPDPIFYALSNYECYEAPIRVLYDLYLNGSDQPFYESVKFQQPIQKTALYNGDNTFRSFRLNGLVPLHDKTSKFSHYKSLLEYRLCDPVVRRKKHRFVKPKNRINIDEYRVMVREKMQLDKNALLRIVNGEQLVINTAVAIPLKNRHYYKPNVSELIPPNGNSSVTEIKLFIISLRRLLEDQGIQDAAVNDQIAKYEALIEKKVFGVPVFKNLKTIANK